MTEPMQFILLLIGAFAVTYAAPAALVRLSWAPNPETNISHYVVYYGSVGGDFTHATNTVTNGMALTLAGTNRFKVTAVNDWGLESLPSNEVQWPPLLWLTNSVWYSQSVDGHRHLISTEAIGMQPGFYFQTLQYGPTPEQHTNMNYGATWWQPAPKPPKP